MMSVKKIKYLSFFSVALIIGAVIYHQIPFKFEHLGYTDKIWAHRVNSIEKLEYTQENYTGIELDIMFDKSTLSFDVNHPPAASINLNLDTYFSQIDSIKKLGIWLDFKNLDSINRHEALNRLLQLTEKYHLNKSSIIVESQFPEYLDIFSNVGFITSYYLPTRLSDLNEKNLHVKIEQIKNNILQYPTTAISTNINDYELIATFFPHKKKYLWSIDKTYTSRFFKNFLTTKKALKDSTVKSVLVRVNKDIGRR